MRRVENGVQHMYMQFTVDGKNPEGEFQEGKVGVKLRESSVCFHVRSNLLKD